MSSAHAAATRVCSHPGSRVGPDNPKPGMLGMTRWNASAGSAPWRRGSQSGPATWVNSTMEPGQPRVLAGTPTERRRPSPHRAAHPATGRGPCARTDRRGHPVGHRDGKGGCDHRPRWSRPQFAVQLRDTAREATPRAPRLEPAGSTVTRVRSRFVSRRASACAAKSSRVMGDGSTRNPRCVAAGVTCRLVRSSLIAEASVLNSGVPPPSRTGTTCTRISSTSPSGSAVPGWRG